MFIAILLWVAAREVNAQKLVGGDAEMIVTEGEVLHVSPTPNYSGYRVLTIHNSRLFECEVGVIETAGYERLAVRCVGRPTE